MKVKELIEMLRTFDANAEVKITQIRQDCGVDLHKITKVRDNWHGFSDLVELVSPSLVKGD